MSERTLDQVRDRIAELQGWTFNPKEISHLDGMTGENVFGVWRREGEFIRSPHHPLGPLTLDAAAKIIKDLGWRWTREWQSDQQWWAAFPPDWDGEVYPTTPDTDDQPGDLMRLALACLEAKETPHA